MSVSDVALPWNWEPRPYQRALWEYLSRGGKRAVACWHRRSGKDETLLHHMACAAHERVGTYWYMLPQYGQARKSMWEAVNPHTGKRRIDDAFPHEVRKVTRENEMMIGFHNGSTLQLVGSDSFDALVGSPPVGIVFSEYALANPSAWAYMRPILLENGGWAAFNSTPRGKNHFKAMCDHAQKAEGWFYSRLTNDETRVFSETQMADELSELIQLHGEDYGRSLWLQEYFVSFDAAIPGSIFGDKIARLRENGGVGVVPVEPGVPVHTGWDLGRTDDTVIWFYQVFAGSVRVIGYHASSLKDIPFYVEVLREWGKRKGVTFGTHWLPHDARPRTLAAGGKSILQQFHDANEKLKGALGKFAIAKRLDKQEQIQAARATLDVAWFDEVECEMGLEALTHYHREWDDEKRVFTNTPVHDWSSHPADGWMTVGVSWRAARAAREGDSGTLDTARAIRDSVGGKGYSFGALKRAHLARAKAARQGGM